MQEVAAYSTVFMTLSLVVTRPRIGSIRRLSPAAAALIGVAIMVALGAVRVAQLRAAVTELWSPFVAIASIMIMTEVATRVGLLDWGAAKVEARARSAAHLFGLVFALGIVTATALNNDAAILLLTPLVVGLVRRRFPGRPELVAPFAFAVFIAAGVAALPVSNPMNMVVAEFAGIGFNYYALHMAPIAVAGWAVGYLVLRRWFQRELAAAPMQTPAGRAPRSTPAQRLMLALLLGVLASYSLVGYLGGPVWIVALAGASLSLALARRHGHRPLRLVRHGVSWQTLLFLLAVLVLALGLLQVGLVDRLTALYDGASVTGVGVTSALGSALLNNHPMAYLNMLSLHGAGHGDAGVFAALIGGDLGPRLLPMGSLAGLLWLEMLRRKGVDLRLRQFVTIGAVVTAPTLAVSLLILKLF